MTDERVHFLDVREFRNLREMVANSTKEENEEEVTFLQTFGKTMSCTCIDGVSTVNEIRDGKEVTIHRQCLKCNGGVIKAPELVEGETIALRCVNCGEGGRGHKRGSCSCRLWMNLSRQVLERPTTPHIIKMPEIRLELVKRLRNSETFQIFRVRVVW